jgi:O-antigen chain-terminating methyltransferase
MPENETIDVRSLMKEIERRVHERIANGEFSEEEIIEISELPLNILPNLEDLLDEIQKLTSQFDALLTPLNNAWVTYKTYPKPGVKGKIFTLIRKLLSPLTKLLLSEQVRFNAEIVQSFNMLKVYLARINDLNSNLYWRQNRLSNIFEDKNYNLKETQRRLFTLVLESMKRQRNIRKDIRRLLRESLKSSAHGVFITPQPVEKASIPQDKELEASLYLTFEDLHRGNREDIMRRQKIYLSRFSECKNVLDIGCGRGEFLEVLKKEGIQAWGIDINPTMVSYCRDLGLKAEEADALRFLSKTEKGVFDGIFCAQVVEHLSWSEIIHLVKLAYEKLPPGGKLLMETINPQCLTTFSGTFYLDPTHTKPVHPLTLQFACKAIGFTTVDILYTSPFPDEMKLQEVDFFRRTGDISDKLVNVLNNNVIQLNELLYGPQDYAVLATKGEAPLS